MRCPGQTVVFDADLPQEGRFMLGDGSYLPPDLMRHHTVGERLFARHGYVTAGGSTGGLCR